MKFSGISMKDLGACYTENNLKLVQDKCHWKLLIFSLNLKEKFHPEDIDLSNWLYINAPWILPQVKEFCKGKF